MLRNWKLLAFGVGALAALGASLASPALVPFACVLWIALGVALALLGSPEPPYDEEEAERVRAEVIQRTWETGRPHVANLRSDGTWEVREVGDA